MLAANRIGKTEAVGGYEMVCHLTGIYPDWWNGRRFNRPINAWAAGATGETVRDIIQEKLLGPIHEPGTGLLPAHTILDTRPRVGIPEAKQMILVKHASGGTSQLNLKSYDQKRKSFEGTKKDVIWLDEEPPADVYAECLLRTMKTSIDSAEEGGLMMLTFTPLLGMSEVVLSFLPGGEIKELDDGAKFVVMATWDDAPHLSKEERELLWNAIPPYQRDARSKGIPQLGSGAIYPVPESDILVPDFPLPDHWPRAYALDVGWNRTAAIWGALNRESDTLYLYSEYYRGQAEPSVHAEGIKSRGNWIKGVVDPAARGRSQNDGHQLIQSYKDLGLNLETAFNGVESGIYETWQRLSSGRIKVFNSLENWKSEFRLYRRDEKGMIVKNNDHLMDCMRYFVMSGLKRVETKPIETPDDQDDFMYGGGRSSGGWMS